MIIFVRVHPKASKIQVIKESGGFKVYLTKPAIDGLANEQLIELLSSYLKVKQYQIKIIKGLKSRNKIVEINA